ncbi:glucoamylase family protein [Mucisphaera sp.]|uniref:glucoamylase family protein n=1 Tax=Mucisphaera sp. TaxID=2913024 RepID=UPI003D12A7E1
MPSEQSDDGFLEELSRRSFDFFWREGDPDTGLVPDRALADGTRGGDVASIASMGFGLTAYTIGVERGWISYEQGYDRTLNTLLYLRDELENVRGFFYHFVDMETGERVWECELSSIDTALLIAGVLSSKAYFEGTEVAEVAQQIYDRVEWPWMHDGKATLSMGWKPESGFLPYHWHDYNELKILYLLGLGSETHPLAESSWHAWRRVPLLTYGGRTFLACAPLFTHQYSQAWYDFRNKRDDYADYWRNSVLATLAQQQAVVDKSDRFPLYSPTMWGLTAADGPDGYRVLGSPMPTSGRHEVDGAVVPCAPGGSIPMAPEATIPALREMKEKYPEAWTTYGFVDAFNPHTGWYNADVIGIDVGITLLMAENHRSGFVWDLFARNPEVQRGMARAGFRPLTLEEKQQSVNVSVFTDEPLPPDVRDQVRDSFSNQ